ncbi:hypothetical protein [Ferrimonas sp. SCSIO 43195]|uniref:hypothetical protein n=1 Tax=Ferrimonas sp. SCSIO 43195 TaxID=2822844 RepID=UPI002075C024|nr:hypothetical protein [Ferrimonas sp. SCSIO 43195]USD37130.1 hypothetical protein J8Z22_19430 [Ferrimonas sp. SCSIO 43195]
MKHWLVSLPALALLLGCSSSADRLPPQEYFSFEQGQDGYLHFSLFIEGMEGKGERQAARSGAKRGGKGGGRRNGGDQPPPDSQSDRQDDQLALTGRLAERVDHHLKLNGLCDQGYEIVEQRRLSQGVAILGECRL